MLVCGRDPVPFGQAGITDNYFKPPNSPRRTSHTFSDWFSLYLLRFLMAALESTRFVPFALPPLNPSFCNNDTLWPAKTGRSIHSVTGSQGVRSPTATFSSSGYQAEAGRNVAAKAEGM
jgi:hypothetical protein